MSTLARKQDDSKLLAMADNVIVRNRVYKRARHAANSDEEERQYGRLNKSINELAETAEMYRKAGT